jgi:hemerythrin-like metal-binding protein
MAKHDPIVWDETLMTRIPQIDVQHRILIDMINDARSFLGIQPSKERLEKVVRDLMSYADYHFDTEAELMTTYEYAVNAGAECEAHEAQHRGFSNAVFAVKEDLRAGREVTPESLVHFLESWLRSHILNTDMALARYILSKKKP